MSTAVRRLSTDAGRGHTNLRRQSVVGRASMDGARAAMIMTSAQSRLPQGPRMENTYKLEPEETFPSCSVKSIIYDVFAEMLKGKSYEPAESALLSNKLADVIKNKVKEIGPSRYKIVVFVTLGQQTQSSIAFASRCVWNHKLDTFAENTYKNGNMYAVGLVYGVYME